MQRESSSGHPPDLLNAYGDESVRVMPDGSMAYLLAAVILPERACQDVRATLRPMAPRGQKFHWRDEHPQRRLRMTETIAACGIESVVVVGGYTEPRRQERARRKLLGVC